MTEKVRFFLAIKGTIADDKKCKALLRTAIEDAVGALNVQFEVALEELAMRTLSLTEAEPVFREPDNAHRFHLPGPRYADTLPKRSPYYVPRGPEQPGDLGYKGPHVLDMPTPSMPFDGGLDQG